MSKPITQQSAPLLGIDWGTTNRRAYLLDEQGELLRRHDDECGILSVAGDFAKSLDGLLAELKLDRVDVIMSGMVGSRNGWREVPYLEAGQSLPRLSQAMHEIDAGRPDLRCRIVPGYRFSNAAGVPDVMRGEETQVLGALSLAATDGWFLLPGTHSKWVLVQDGSIRDIITFMTGELFALLKHHGTLASLMKEDESTVPAAFEAGLEAARHGGFTHLAFTCRALVVTGAMPAAHASSYLSGLLIGAEMQEIRARAGAAGRMPVQLIGSPALAARYVDALEIFGMAPSVWQPDDVYVAALRVLAGITPLTLK
ncbi:MAG: hypothetical protein JWQ23_4486 [Herminiimonas sp.]|nr:hypothetical protein [Herminiimonas sp.]